MKATHGMFYRLLVCLHLVAFALPSFSQLQIGQSAIDSMETRLRSSSSRDTAIIPLLISLTKIYLFKDAKKSIEFAREAVNISEKLKKPVDPMIYMYMARAYARIPDDENAVASFKTAISAAAAQKDSLSMAWIYDATGYYYYNIRNVPFALTEFDKAIEYAHTLKDTVILSEAWFGKSLAFTVFEEYDSTYGAVQQYLIYADPKHEQRRLSDAYRLIGLYYQSIKQYQKAIDANKQSYDIAASVSDSAKMAAALNHIAWYYYEMGNLDKSLETYHKNIGFYDPRGNNDLANVYGNMGNIYRDWGRYPEAIDYYNKSIELSGKNHDMYNLSWLYKDISKLYERTGDYRQAYENQVLGSIYSDSLMTANYQQHLASARAQYEADKTAKELELLSVRLQRNRFLTWGLIGGFGLIASITVLFINRFRFRSKQKMDAMNHTISELNQTNLRQQMNPHFIFNTLNSIQYYVFQNDKISSNNYMTKFASLIRKTLENSRNTEISIKEELDTLRLYLELEELRFKEKFNWTISVDEDIDTLAYKIPTMLIQPYVENAITHGLMNKENGKGFLHVGLQLHDDQIICIIQDNGIGRSKAMEIKQQKNENHRSLGTNITESRLRLVNELYGKSMKVIYTDLVDENNEPAGTKVEINIPIIT